MWSYLYKWEKCGTEPFLIGGCSLVATYGTSMGPILALLFVYLYKEMLKFIDMHVCMHTQTHASKLKTRPNPTEILIKKKPSPNSIRCFA